MPTTKGDTMMTGQRECMLCDSDDICCSSATYDDGTHDEPLCRAHCGPHFPRRPSPTYERMDCGA
jgi:hypothetical protein